jgi:exocyst complex protein 7
MVGFTPSGRTITTNKLSDPMDDESADIELLEQHLNRSSQLSTRMTTVLQKFDRRLQKLEKSILPLHKSTQSLTKLVDSTLTPCFETSNVAPELLYSCYKDIDKTLLTLDQIAASRPQVLVDETLIMKGYG